MDWLLSLAPVLTPLCGMTGVLGGAWLVHRQHKRKNDQDANLAESKTFIAAVTTVTEGFTGLLEQQRAATAQTLDRVATLETKQTVLERKVETLEEEQRQWRRWKAAAVDYIHQLRAMLANLHQGPAPTAPREIAEDLGD
ncbi:hypothetical protein OHT59_40205 [Streptomyces sp. NBC_00243]|uniref:hypothetical protein n=1 Tax=Streptomyces sp. NBC_00243 TaxID=2975688 RepID=UPI002DD874B7|nr:hypothetical protein [Streptomyces sp. NBC_00243]WRZ24298.1 hypothetical protein OHT59_40205 [Streptomyces sp. NBC_00243]